MVWLYDLGAPFIALTCLIVATALSVLVVVWLQPLVHFLATPHGNWLKRTAFRPLHYVAKAVLDVVQITRAALSRFAYWNLHLLVRQFNALAALVHDAFREMNLWHDAVADFADRLVLHTIPNYVGSVVRPIDERAKARAKQLQQGIDKLRGLNASLSHGIDRLHARVDADAARFARGIDRLARENIGTRLRDLEHASAGILTRDLPALWRRERALERKVNGELSARLSRIEKALGLGLAGAVVYRVLARVAPWLFCRNVKVAGRALCGMNPNTLNALLAAALATVAIEDLRTLTQYAQKIESEVTKDVKRLLSV